jgi:hypothetical protein
MAHDLVHGSICSALFRRLAVATSRGLGVSAHIEALPSKGHGAKCRIEKQRNCAKYLEKPGMADDLHLSRVHNL